jgi:hypothetical protein
MSLVQDEYDRRMQALSPKERVARSAAMFQWAREMIARQIVKESGPLPQEVLKWRVAQRLYGREPQAAALIERMLADVSR